MEPVVTQPTGGQPFRRRHPARPPERGRRAEPDVVEQDDQHVRRPFRRQQRLDRRERRVGVLGVIGRQPGRRPVGDRQHRAGMPVRAHHVPPSGFDVSRKRTSRRATRPANRDACRCGRWVRCVNLLGGASFRIHLRGVRLHHPGQGDRPVRRIRVHASGPATSLCLDPAVRIVVRPAGLDDLRCDPDPTGPFGDAEHRVISVLRRWGSGRRDVRRSAGRRAVRGRTPRCGRSPCAPPPLCSARR